MPYNTAALRELISAAFSDEELKIFCSDNFRDVYNDFTNDQSKNERILKLIEYVDHHNQFDQLDNLLKHENPEKYKEFEPRLQSITDALAITLAAIKSDQDYLKRRFDEILSQIDRLTAYKALHDGLHEIQYSYYQQIIDNSKIVKDDKYAKYDLFSILRDYRRVTSKLQEATAGGKTDAEEGSWIARLDQAGNDLEGGVKAGNKDQMDSATQTINQIIGTQPTIINRKLYSAVYAYNQNLPKLTDVMNQVCQNLNSIEPSSKRVEQFQHGQDSLRDMNKNLGTLIAEHDTWQNVDNQLKILPDILTDFGVAAFKKRWEAQKVQIKPFYDGKTDKSSILLKEAEEMLDGAISEDDPRGVQKAFENYCSQASDRFFYVDKQVMDICEKLRQITADLN